MKKFRVTFTDMETNKRKNVTVYSTGIIPAIDEAVRKAMLFGWEITNAELIK